MPRTFEGPLLNNSLLANRAWFDNLPLALDPDYLYYMDDFFGVVIDVTNDWTVVKDSGASVALAADVQNGEVLLTSAATTDNDGASIQGNEVYLPTASKDIWFEARVKGSTVADMDLYVGLVENFATNPEAALTASNRIGFQIDDGNASILCKSEASDVETSKDSEIDAVDDTYLQLGFHLISNTTIEYYVNRALKATITTNIPATEMALAAMELSGSTTGTRSMAIDYIMCAVQR